MGSIWKENQRRMSRKNSIDALDSHDLLRLQDQANLVTNASGIADILIIGTPSADDIIKYNGSNWVFTPDASGGGSAASTFAEVLEEGNLTGGFDIVISGGDKITAVTAQALNIEGSEENDVIITSASTTSFGGGIYLTGGQSSTQAGGAVYLTGGLGQSGGIVNITGGIAQAGGVSGGHVTIRGGSGPAGRGTVRLGAASGDLVSFYGATGVTRRVVSGSDGGNAALQSLITALEELGLIVDSTS